MEKGKVNIGNYNYYFSSNGAMQTDWFLRGKY
ncbi:hypothetical protein [Bacillus sp. S14(2024)]